MKYVLFDKNVILDVLLGREKHFEFSQKVWQASDDGRIHAYLTANTFTDIFYIIRKIDGFDAAFDAVRLCLEAFEVCPIDRDVIVVAERMTGRDFEDNVQIACAEKYGLDAIVTRDDSGFGYARLPVLSPQELVEKLGLDGE